VRVFDGEVTIRPIAGTRKRGATPEEDRALEADLLADEKELAEHLMLLDLGRNDVGRVAKIGSVRPTEEFIVERYSHVMHIVSNVVGELSDEHDALSALLAGLPAGTVSGAPKVRAMEIIDELEPEKRGVYGGGVGYFSAGGDMDMCIALRTAVVQDGTLYIQAGGGVVYDSDPQAEFEETENKARAIRRAADAGAVLAAAVVVLFATVPIWGWLALVTFLLLTGTALLSFTDPASRAFLAGTLRKSTYTQIYTTLTRRLVMRLWSALCDPAEDRASVPSLFRAALTWRLYDKALLIAVAYPRCCLSFSGSCSATPPSLAA
jgi:hypothetical protein